ncbi:MAG TPA: Tol-Pal system beta propeller repeat protein TolB [Acetobacteraceae bacterium]|nr:Tol-Pal system beta propeller repeat protein TolB [Acetobacteraceae bacterium]
MTQPEMDKTRLGRRTLLAGAAGTAALISAVPLRAQQPPAAPGGAPTAVIDVNRARAAPIPIAITNLAGADPASATLGQQISQIVTADLTSSGLFRPINQAAFIQEPPGATQPAFQNWAAIGAQALVTGAVQVTGGTLRVEFRLWDVLPQTQLQGTAYTTTTANVRRIAHIIADVIYERLLGEKGYFDTRIAYVSGSGPRGREVRRLAIMDQDGFNQRILTDGSWTVLTPRFSPVRDQLAFMSYANNRPRVYLFDLGSGRQSVLGDFEGMTFAPRFSPDGSRVIMSLAHGSGSDIVVVSIGSRTMERLTHSDSIDVSPCYSPDGSQIVFASDRGGDQQLYVMGASGGGAKRISFGSGRYGTPVWSPRGDLIAFTRYGGAEGGFNIGVMHPDGSGERLLAQGWDVEGPTFAPNGRVMMYFSQTRAGAGGAGFSSVLKSVDITGFGDHVVPATGNATDPAWSPLGG